MDNRTFHHDPYLSFQPHFATSLPVQILLIGIILTLATVLLFHLLFTAQYHWALARLNYGLQLAGVLSLLINVCAMLGVILTKAHQNSRDWPYMLDYISVDIPPTNWTITEQGLWLFMEATTSGLAHVTHIQFLTLLYPSQVEARLIFLLLGPLALASSAMTFTSLSDYPRARDLGDAIRGVCNTTLSLLFGAALFIWGFIINRSRAWRTDGGTAAFGAGACILAVMSAVVNFVLIFEDTVHWLPYLLWAVVLWQSFLGWWWWVGSGMGIGEVEDMLSRAQEKEKLRKHPRRRKRASKNAPSPRGVSSPIDVVSRVVNTVTRRKNNTSSFTAMNDDAQSIHSSTTNTHSSGSHPPDGSDITWFAFLPRWIEQYFIRLRAAHYQERATALESIEVVGSTRGRPGGTGSPGGVAGGWGLGNFGIREREEAERRVRIFRRQEREGQFAPEGSRSRSRSRPGEGGVKLDSGSDTEPEVIEMGVMGERERTREGAREGGRARERDDDAGSTGLSSLPDPLPPNGSWFWRWGPLRRWRLQDRTVYE